MEKLKNENPIVNDLIGVISENADGATFNSLDGYFRGIGDCVIALLVAGFIDEQNDLPRIKEAIKNAACKCIGKMVPPVFR